MYTSHKTVVLYRTSAASNNLERSVKEAYTSPVRVVEFDAKTLHSVTSVAANFITWLKLQSIAALRKRLTRFLRCQTMLNLCPFCRPCLCMVRVNDGSPSHATRRFGYALQL